MAWIGVFMAAAIPATLGAAEVDNRARMDLGRQVFTKIAQPSCGICRTLVDEGAKGEIGAKLEELQPDEERAPYLRRGT